MDAALHKIVENERSFFATDDYWDGAELWVKYQARLTAVGANVVSSQRAKNLDAYAEYWANGIKSEDFSVSPMEGHPSKLAHQMYADVMADEILRNPRCGFPGSER